MMVATIGPFAVPVVRTVPFASPSWRARRAVVLSFGAFAAGWIALASVLHVVAELLRASALPGHLLGGLLVAAPAYARLCWPAMVAMVAVPGSWWPMAALSAAGLAEPTTAPRGRSLPMVPHSGTATALVLS